MMKKLLFAIMIMSLASLGQTQGLGIGPQLGYQRANDADEGSFFGGASARLKLSSTLAIEGAFFYRTEEYVETEGVASTEIQVTNWPIMVTGMFYPLPIAYGLMGAGWYHSTIEYNVEGMDLVVDEEQTETAFGWHFGGGVEVPLGTHTTLTGDIRYVFLDYDFDAVPGEEVENDFYMINVGLLFGL
jgi:opacity protein-like surface antigen